MKVFASTPAAVGVLALASSLLAVADWAAAQPTEQQVAAIKSACRSDYMSYCWSVPRGGAEALQCLKKNVASLSAPCQQAVKAVTAAAAAPTNSGTAASAAKPATETKPAAAAAEPATSSSPTETQEAATSAPAGPASSAAAAAAQGGAANTATPAGPSAAASNAKAEPGSSTSSASSQGKAAPKKPSAESSQASAQAAGAVAAGSAGAASAGASKPKPTAEATAPVAAATGAAMPQALGFIPPRKKIMLARFCRDDFNTYCPGVDVGGGRAILCLEDNKAQLAPECRDALVKLGR